MTIGNSELYSHNNLIMHICIVANYIIIMYLLLKTVQTCIDLLCFPSYVAYIPRESCIRQKQNTKTSFPYSPMAKSESHTKSIQKVTTVASQLVSGISLCYSRIASYNGKMSDPLLFSIIQ